MVAIIDYDAGNIKSVEKALEHLGEEVMVSGDKDVILSADRVVLPGVGAFGDAMDKIRRRGLDQVIWDVADQGIPFLGICLGLQLMFESSEEAAGVACDAALLPIGGKYTMDPAQAAELANRIRPALVVPVHYGSVTGGAGDFERFAAALDPEIRVQRVI